MRILLTNAHRNAGFFLTRHLGRGGHRLIAADSRRLAFGFRSRYAEAYAQLPELHAPDYGDHLLALTRRVRPDVLLPLGGLGPVSARRDLFERETAVLAADADAYAALADKALVYTLCARLGIPHPRVLGTDPDTVAGVLDEPAGARGERTDGPPLAVIKPRKDWGAGQGLTFVRERAGLVERWHAAAARHGPLVATEFVPGPVSSQYSVQLLFDGDGALIEFFVLRKLRQWPVGSGITVAATSSHELELVEQMLPLFRSLRWRGPAEVELKRHARTGEACVLEINPRFSGTVAFPLSAGVDMAESMVRASVGTSIPRPLEPYYAAELRYWNPWPYARSVLHDLAHARRIGQGLRGLAMPFTGRAAGNPYVLSDPLALIGKLGSQIPEAWRARRSAHGGDARL